MGRPDDEDVDEDEEDEEEEEEEEEGDEEDDMDAPAPAHQHIGIGWAQLMAPEDVRSTDYAIDTRQKTGKPRPNLDREMDVNGLRVKFSGSASDVATLFDGFTYELTTGADLYEYHGIIRAMPRRSVHVQWFGTDVDTTLYIVAPKSLYALIREEFDPSVERKCLELQPGTSSLTHPKNSMQTAIA